MEIIDLNKSIKEQFEKIGFAYPYLKSSKKWGIKGSTLLDAPTLEEAERKFINYLLETGLIKIKK